MPASNICWGIEVGAHAIKAVKLELAGEGKCRIADWAFIPHPKVLSTPGVDPNDVIRVSLGALTNQVELGKVPGHSSFARFAKLPPVDPKKVADIVKFEAAQQIPFPLEEVEWDYQTFVTPDSPEVEVGIFAVTKERINERLQMLEDVGVTPNFIALSPIAVYNALGRVWVRTFPLGGHNFTEALVNQFQLSYPKAEKLKREAQDTKHARQVFQAMRPVFTDLAQDIQRSIGYFQSLNNGTELTRVIGVGATWRLPGLRKYLKQQLGLDVYRIDNFKKIGSGSVASTEDSEDGGEVQAAEPQDRKAQFDLLSLEMTTAYGLALQGLGLNSVSGNLMPVTSVRASMWKDKVKWFGLAAGVATAAAGVMFVNPVRSNFAVQAAQPDPAINQAISRAKELTRQAGEAGVTSAGEPNMAAANVMSLQQQRDVYSWIVSDVQKMFASADTRKGTWAQSIQVSGQPAPVVAEGPAYSMTVLSTDYIPPADAASGRGSLLPKEYETYPGIRVDMQVTTSVPEPDRFVRETINRWLVENSKRVDVPYVILYAGVRGQDYVIGEAKADGAALAGLNARDRQQEEAAAAARGRDRQSQVTGDGRYAGGGDGGEREARRGQIGPRGGRGGQGMPGGGGESAEGGRGDFTSTDLDTQAPIDAALGKPPAQTAGARFVWDVVFVPPAAAKAAEDATTGGGT
jgi:type IV pilus assembly protein PilM